MQTPDQLMEEFETAVMGMADIDPHEVLHKIIEDILDTVEKAVGTFSSRMAKKSIMAEINDYVSNHYGD